MSVFSQNIALSQKELQAISHEEFMRKADRVNAFLYKLVMAAICMAIIGLLFVRRQFLRKQQMRGVEWVKQKRN